MAFGGWGTFLAAVAGPIAKRVLVSLGVGVLTVAGVQAMITAALNAAKAAMGGLSGEVLQILALSGAFSAVSIIAGGLTAAGTVIAFKKLAVL